MAKKAAPKKKTVKRKRVKAIPDDMPPISAHLTVASISKSLALYQKAFGFKPVGEPMRAGRSIIHAVLGYRGGMVMLGPTMPTPPHKTPNDMKVKAQAFGLFVYVANVDKHYQQVKRFKSLKATEPVTMFWGDRTYDVVDPDGHRWTFASRKSNPTPDEMAAAMAAMAGK